MKIELILYPGNRWGLAVPIQNGSPARGYTLRVLSFLPPLERGEYPERISMEGFLYVLNVSTLR
jgi:hypothetical protein